MNASSGSTGRRAGSSDRSTSRTAAQQRGPWRPARGRARASDGGESTAIAVARWLVVAALFYATALLGAVEPVVQYHVCLVVLGAVVIALLAPSAQPARGSGRVAGLLATACIWLLFTALQTAPLPEDLVRFLSPGLAALRESYAPAMQSATPAPRQTLSLVPALTESVWPVYAIALAFFWLGLATGNNRRGRAQLLVALTAGGTALAVWGMLQRAGGSHLVLPGRPAPENAVPFATLVYKNAGASLLIAALAAAIGLWLVALRPLLRQRRRQLQQVSGGDAAHAGSPRAAAGQRSRSRRHGLGGRRGSGESGGRDVFDPGGNRWWAMEPRAAAVMVAIAVLAAGLAASLSRGAWIAAAVALIVWAACCRRDLSASLWGKFAAVLVALAVILIGWFGAGGAVASRAAEMDFGVLAANDRVAHWRDAVEAVAQYPWVGAGLGTYGYAHLPLLEHDAPRWFHHAHSQPLEWAVETGAAGMVLLTVGTGLMIAVLIGLYRRRRQSSAPLIWFSVGTVAAIGLVVQSTADFAVLTPAVMWGYALLFGVVARVAIEVNPGSWEVSSANPARPSWPKLRGASPRRDGGWPHWGAWLLRHVPAAAAVWAIAALLISQSWIHDRVIDQQLLKATRLPRVRTVAPSAERIERSRQLLQQRLRDRPHQNRLWQQLALWDVARYRSEMMSEAQRRGEPVQWIQTEPRLLFQAFHAAKPAARPSRSEAWLGGPEQRQAVARARKHLVRSLHCNPLVPQVYLQLAWLSPLTGDPYRPLAEKCRVLARSHGEMQFELGLLARADGQRREMVELWRRCLRYRPEHFDAVFRAADGVLTPEEIASDLLAELRSNVWMSLVRRSMREEAFAEYRPAFLEAARQKVTADDRLADGQRHAYLANLCGYAGDLGGSLKHMHGAVEADPANPDYRYRFAHQLLKAGRLREARDATTLGRALEPGSTRFTKLLQQIDRRLSSARLEPGRQNKRR